jgi:hypothetical protein
MCDFTDWQALRHRVSKRAWIYIIMHLLQYKSVIYGDNINIVHALGFELLVPRNCELHGDVNGPGTSSYSGTVT